MSAPSGSSSRLTRTPGSKAPDRETSASSLTPLPGGDTPEGPQSGRGVKASLLERVLSPMLLLLLFLNPVQREAV